MKKLFLTILLGITTLSAHANIVINTTRVIYPASNKEVSVQLLNAGDQPSLVQSWIDDGDPNSTPETAKVPFLLTPPVVKIDGNNGQQLRIKYISNNLPTDRESLFYLNVLDIPPVAENISDKNVMQIAIRTRIKFFYRPDKLSILPKQIQQHIVLKREGSQLKLENASPYFMSIVGLKSSDTQPNLLNEGTIIKPFSSHSFSTNEKVKVGDKLTLAIVDDFGAINKLTLPLQ
ncbi:fimbria/pilus periplasmic chaperone [Photorhabdus laumondii subsp. laumondii]|uniref:Photorhabdus luminescens subsp. laumondii TTO1 complete genome segment 2/17 n=3 Tax=Photorhabdus laumondii TaxID=2218628 RepID=Q7N943_PHOLL|nr:MULTISPECIES: molecular chaperone [Photorhabdus]PQQ35820.1 molecular chaperone [Photorhabdus luminescens]AWK40470.1 pilus assembly protein [Photorhabdus laumondii subsp. laumondii]AXG41279.1 molecular chaperone [Photorhabdus laumondii subsp. laumondii]AXG45810.1 molecular chaperone [Photorhabdus laumondii subsp. laumondii]KTL61600.1 pilus assembly protein [Photorhabdus laumondii subsp. laumondii]